MHKLLFLNSIITFKKVQFVLKTGHFIYQIGPGGQLTPLTHR